VAYATPVRVYLHTKYVALFPDFQPHGTEPHDRSATTVRHQTTDEKQQTHYETGVPKLWFLCKEGDRDEEVLLLSKERHKSSHIADEDKIICRREEARLVSTEWKIAQKEIFVKDKVSFNFAISGRQMQVKKILSEIHQSN
jgi:hypothetical protein